MHFRKLLFVAGLLSVTFAGTAVGAFSVSGATVPRRAHPSVSAVTQPSLASCRRTVQRQTYSKGILTVATDDPAYPPWFEDNTPSNGKGYESAVAYEVGSLLGFDRKQVKWVTEPFDSSYAPGPKAFDFDINEVSVTPDRAKVVTFSISYYNTTQSIVALRSNPIVTKHTPAELRTYLYGDQIGIPEGALDVKRALAERAIFFLPAEGRAWSFTLH